MTDVSSHFQRLALMASVPARIFFSLWSLLKTLRKSRLEIIIGFGTYCNVTQHPEKRVTVAEDATKELKLSENVLLHLHCWKLCLILQ